MRASMRSCADARVAGMSLGRVGLRQDGLGDFLDLARDEQGRAADHADLRLAIFIVAEPGDIFGDDKIIAAARLERNELHWGVS